jgi:hypothetical protein
MGSDYRLWAFKVMYIEAYYNCTNTNKTLKIIGLCENSNDLCLPKKAENILDREMTTSF